MTVRREESVSKECFTPQLRFVVLVPIGRQNIITRYFLPKLLWKRVVSGEYSKTLSFDCILISLNLCCFLHLLPYSEIR